LKKEGTDAPPVPSTTKQGGEREKERKGEKRKRMEGGEIKKGKK